MCHSLAEQLTLCNDIARQRYEAFSRRISMSLLKTFSRTCKTRLVELMSDLLLDSGHFRRTMLRRLFQKHLPATTLAYVTFPDHVLVVDPRDHMIGFKLMSGQHWQRSEFDRAMAITEAAGALMPGGWLIDIGANIGTQSIYALLSGKFRGVIAIEPEPHNLTLLRRNIDLNGFADRVHIVAAAASAQAGTASLVRDRANFGAHSIAANPAMQRADIVAVRSLTVDDILASLNIAARDVSMVLIDAEGHEIEVLKGMFALRRQDVPIAAEITSAILGPGGIEQLRRLLAPDYNLVSPLQDRDMVNGSAPARDLARFEFALRQTDYLIYNTRTIASLKSN